MSDEIDTNSINTISPDRSLLPQPYEFGKNDDTYIMDKFKRTAIIFNHYEFQANAHTVKKTLDTRHGTKKDVVDLQTILETLHFDVTVHNDLKVNEFLIVIGELINKDYSEQDCLAIFVLTHGRRGKYLAAYNGWYKSDELWNSFTGDICPTLVGKPKLIIINACRGDKKDPGVACVPIPEVDGIPKPKTSHFYIPEMADILFAFSSFEDYVSIRNPDDGSWFIQSLCKNLSDEKIGRKELKEILTITSREVANQSTHIAGKRTTQVPTIVSTLIRNLYLRDSNTA